MEKTLSFNKKYWEQGRFNILKRVQDIASDALGVIRPTIKKLEIKIDETIDPEPRVFITYNND